MRLRGVSLPVDGNKGNEEDDMDHKIAVKECEPGKMYVLQFGNGTQLFACEKVSPRGKPSGWRFKGRRSEWVRATLKICDARIIGESDVPIPASLYSGPFGI